MPKLLKKTKKLYDIDAETVIAKIHALTPSPGCFYNNSDKLKSLSANY